MNRRFLRPLLLGSIVLCLATTAWTQNPLGDNPPVFQSIGQLDTLAQSMTEAECRVCHDSGVQDRHHLLYDQPIVPGSIVPYPDSDGDGVDDTVYDCLNCHDENFTVVSDCMACHTAGSPHHNTTAAADLQCNYCHGDLVDNPYDGHYIPTYAASLVTPYRGLDGDGYENPPFPTPDVASTGSGRVVPADVTVTTQGPPFFAVTNIGPLGTVHTRSEPNDLSFKPGGFNNDFVIGSTHYGGETFGVVFTAGSPLAASWDAGIQRLSVTLDATQSALDLVNVINAVTGSVDLEAALGSDGDGSAGSLPSEYYEPLGGTPVNNRNYGAGSCSYCHDTDGFLDGNGHPDGLIWDNRTLHHEIGLPSLVSDGAGGTMSRCDVCHERITASEQSGPNFDFAIRHCERCHGPDSLHNIQADSNGDGTVVVGGEDAGYGHVGRDGGPGDSDCWGCHGFPLIESAPASGPIIPTISSADRSGIEAGTDTAVTLTGSSFTNIIGGTQYTSKVSLTAADGSSVILTPDSQDQGSLVVTIPGDTAPGNYELRAVKADVASNPSAISVTPKVTIREVTGRGIVTINGSGFGGYAEGSLTSVTGILASRTGRGKAPTSVEATVVSWSDTTIEVDFGIRRPKEVTVKSVFGIATSEVGKGKNGKGARANR